MTTMSTTRRLTADEFLAADFPRRAQLINGEMVTTDPGFLHQRLCRRILVALANWVEAGPGRGEAGFGGNWRLDELSLYKPDVWWTDAGHEPDPATAHSDLRPDLAIEVRSPGTWVYDIGTKRRVYEQNGTPELWLVDGFGRVVLVYARSKPGVSRFDIEAELGLSHALVSPLLPGFKLGVDELFADAP